MHHQTNLNSFPHHNFCRTKLSRLPGEYQYLATNVLFRCHKYILILRSALLIPVRHSSHRQIEDYGGSLLRLMVKGWLALGFWELLATDHLSSKLLNFF